MKKFLIPLMTVIVVGAVVLSGCATSSQPDAPDTPAVPEPTPDNPMAGVAIKPDGTPYKFMYSPYSLFCDFMVCTDEVMGNLVTKAGGVYETIDADFSVESQLSSYEDAVIKGYDGLITMPVDSAASVETIDKVSEQGLKCFNLDHLIPTSNILGTATHDQVSMGRVVGQWLVDKAEETGEHITVFEIWGLMSMEGAQRRHKGFHEAVDGNPNITVIESADAQWSNDLANTYVTEVLPTHPEINAIWSMGAMVQGVTEALGSIDRLYPAGDPNHVYQLSCDEDPGSCTNIRLAYLDGAALHSPWEEGDAAMKAMLTYVCLGLPVPREQVFDSFVIDTENIDDSGRYGAPMVWGEMMQQVTDFNAWPVLEGYPEGFIETPTADMKQAGY